MIIFVGMKKMFQILFVMMLMVAARPGSVFAGGGKFGFSGFSGGMMLHTGYVSGGTVMLTDAGGAQVFSQKMSGMPLGIGGALKLHFGNWLRVGTEGYSTSLSYGDFDSYMNIGWGGLLADCLFNANGRFMPFAGVTVGGGVAKNLTVTERTPADFTVENNASFRKYTFMCVVPFAGVEYAATPRVRVVLKADYMLNVSNRQNDFATGPRIYLGFMFYHKKH